MMNLNSPLFDKIRSKPAAEEVRPAEEPRCQHQGCARKGEFRAPKGRNHEGQFFQFCLDHVKQYNQTYKYFAGMSDTAVQSYQKDALTGHRPTWTVGVNGTVAPDSKMDAATLLRAKLERLRQARTVDAIRALPKLGFRGGNVTLPHKERALDAIDELSPVAKRIGAVNTLIVRRGASG